MSSFMVEEIVGLRQKQALFVCGNPLFWECYSTAEFCFSFCIQASK